MTAMSCIDASIAIDAMLTLATSDSGNISS